MIVVDLAEGELCAGTADSLEREFVSVCQAQGLTIAGLPKITVEVGAAAVEQRCGAAPEGQIIGGCVATGDGEIGVATTLSASSHELVHAARHAAGVFGNRFFEEGIAEALRGGERSGYVIANNAALDPVSPGEASAAFETTVGHYITAGHFVSWLLEEHGEAASAALQTSEYATAGDGPAVIGWFAGSYSESIEDAEARWRSDSEIQYWQPGPCRADTATAFVSGVEIEGVLDCAARDTVGVDGDEGDIAALSTCLTFATEVSLTVHVDALDEVEVVLTPISANGSPGVFTAVPGGGEQVVAVTSPHLVVTVRTQSPEPQPYLVWFEE